MAFCFSWQFEERSDEIPAKPSGWQQAVGSRIAILKSERTDTIIQIFENLENCIEFKRFK